MCFTKEAECETQKDEKNTNNYHWKAINHSVLLGKRTRLHKSQSSDDWLGLSDQPLQSCLPALPLQLCSNNLPAHLVVLVHPVSLQDMRRLCLSNA